MNTERSQAHSYAQVEFAGDDHTPDIAPCLQGLEAARAAEARRYTVMVDSCCRSYESCNDSRLDSMTCALIQASGCLVRNS